MPVGEVPEAADAHEALREDVKEESTQEPLCGQCFHTFYASMCPVSPAEGHLTIRKGDQAVVGNGYSMGVAAKVAENMLGAAEWPFDVQDPLLAVEFADEGMKSL